MKKMLLFAAFVPALLGASQLVVESSNSQVYEFSSSSLQKIDLGHSMELQISEFLDASTSSSTFNLAVIRIDENGLTETLCENQLVVPFDAHVSLLFPKYAMKLTFVASLTPSEKPLPVTAPAAK